MYTDLQLSAIKLFGRKDLAEGCIVFQPEYDYTFKIPGDEWDLMVAMRNWFRWTTILEISESKVGFEILWHIPHLEDLFRVAFDRGIYISISPEITRVYKEFWWEPIEIVLVPQTPLLDQPSLPEIISLFK